MSHLHRIDHFLAKALEGWANRWRERLTIPESVADDTLAMIEQRYHEIGDLLQRLKIHKKETT